MGKGRSPCCDKNKVKRGPWSPAEDLKLINFIQNHGHANWRALPAQAGLLRCGKSCRLRWINYLRPDLKRGNIIPEEEEMIIKLHQTYGNKWSKIASFLPGRTDNEIKNIWNTHIKKKLGITCVRCRVRKRKKSLHDTAESPTRSYVSHGDEVDHQYNNTTKSLSNIVESETLGDPQGIKANQKKDEDEQGESPTPSSVSCISNVLTSKPLDESTLETTTLNFDELDFWNSLELDNLCPINEGSKAHEGFTSSDFGIKEPSTSNVETYSWVRFLEIELGLDA